VHGLVFELMAMASNDSQNTGRNYSCDSRLNDDLPSYEQRHIIEALD
tara:strand:- start:29874 stop:30014 length:141 start_codon:yes stop_codon:yes gene_type:complete